MYTLIGQPWKTATVLNAAQTLFTNAPNGVTGNDDLGTMSAWYLFSAMGLYPAVPGTGQFLLHAPRFSRVDIALANGKRLRIDAPGAGDGKPRFIDSVRVDGKAHEQVWLDWERLQQGGTLRFALTGNAPQQGWGTRPQDLPPSACAVDGAGLQF
jgi:putative alpha-1,2-mannosidase